MSNVILQSNAVKLDGFATWLDDTPCVIVDANSPASRMQFDYAHELAHLIFDEDNPPDDVLVERRANMFASALLMPKESFTADCPKRYSSRMYASVKQQWHVSIAAILYRARALGIISEASYKSAQISRTRMGVRIEEEAEFSRPVPTLLDQGMALISDDIRLDDMALDLGMTVQELRTVLLLQKVSMDVIDKMMPQPVKAHIFDFSVYRDKE